MQIPNDVYEFWKEFEDKVNFHNHQTIIITNDLIKYTGKFKDDSAKYRSLSRIAIDDWIGLDLGFTDSLLTITDGLETNRESYLKKLDDRIKWIFKLSYAQSFEDFERFWKNVFHSHFISTKPEGYIKLYRNGVIDREHLRSTDKEFVQGLKLINPDLYSRIAKSLQVRQIYKALALGRHKIIHNYGEIQPDDYKDNCLFELFFSVVTEPNGKSLIDMPKIQYSHALQKMVNLGFMVCAFFKYTVSSQEE